MNQLKNIKAVIFDWAGTIIDYGCMAPTQVFIEVFKRKNILITIEEARAPMGLAKKDHVSELLNLDTVREQWIREFGQFPSNADVEAIYAELEPALSIIVKNYSEPIPGAINLINSLKNTGYKSWYNNRICGQNDG